MVQIQYILFLIELIDKYAQVYRLQYPQSCLDQYFLLTLKCLPVFIKGL